MPGLDATFFEPARTRPSADAWDAAFREGAALNFEEAIAYALDEQHPQAANPAAAAPARAARDH